MDILVTGALGFIGAHLCERLLEEGHTVFGLDTIHYLDDYKRERMHTLKKHRQFIMFWHDIGEPIPIDEMWTDGIKPRDGFDLVYHLAASTGVQASKDYYDEYFRNNVIGFQNVLNACHLFKIPKLVYTSSSSVYGEMDYDTEENSSTGQQLSYYAGTKRASEALAKSMSAHFLETKVVCCRLFTVYGPRGRKDMAPYMFAEKIAKGEVIELRDGENSEINLSRDFTYIDDVVDGLMKVTGAKFLYGNKRYLTYNIGHGYPILVRDFISLLEQELGKEAIIKHVPLPDGDVPVTSASMMKYQLEVDFNRPETDPETGVKKFVTWFKEYRADLFTV